MQCVSFVKYLVPCVSVPVFQMKKSGKEPKAAAELVLGNTSYKTKVFFT